ncbi:MAG: hypothetical protein ABI785_07220 [Gemmatimonadales bacterium]
MNQGLEHEELQDMLPAAALEILEEAELQRVLAHARACAECARLLEEYGQVTAGLSLQLPQAGQLDSGRSAVLRARLLAKARGDRRGVLPGPHQATTLIYRWSGWMVAAGLTSVLLVHHSIHRPLDYGWLATGALLAILIAVGIYAHVQRARAAALRDRVAALERRTPNS